MSDPLSGYPPKGARCSVPAFRYLFQGAVAGWAAPHWEPGSRATTVGSEDLRNFDMAIKAVMGQNEGIGRRLLNVREAAQYLGLEVDTIYKKARLREVPCVKVGRALRFDVRALERFVEEHTIETID